MIYIYKRIKSEKQKSGYLKEHRILTSGSWVSLISPTNEEIEKISKLTKVPKSVFEEMLDDESAPKVEKEIEEGYISIILRRPHFEADQSLITTPFGIIFPTKKECIITVSKYRDPIMYSLCREPPKNFFTDIPMLFLVFVMRKLVSIYMSHLSIIENEIKITENSLKEALENDEIVFLLSLQKTLVYFRTSIIGNKKVTERIFSGKILPSREEYMDMVEDIIIDIEEAKQLIEIYTEILSNTMDAYTSIISNNLNVIMKVLTLITIFLSVPTIIASLYGMNVSLPLQQDPYAFWYVIIISTFIIVLFYIYFKYKKWWG